MRREIGDADDDMNRFMLEIQQANDLSVKFLNDLGYKGDLLKAKIRRVPKARPLTVPNSRARQERIAEAASHGARFLATGGDHVTSDDAFKAAEIAVQKRKIKTLDEEKETAEAFAETLTLGLEVMNSGKEIDALKVPELDKILDMHQVEKKGRGKLAQKRTKVAELWSQPPPLGPQWTEADEASLVELKEMKIDIKDTALGRYQAQEKQRVRAAVRNMTDDERGDLLEDLVNMEESRLALEMDETGPLLHDVDHAEDAVV